MIVLANHKGGVTKTTSTANLGAMLAEAGRRVLIVDCDPQANLSEAFGWTEDVPGSGSRTCSPTRPPPAGTRRRLALQPDVAPGLAWRERLRIIPSTDALADVAADLPATAGPGYELRLREVLEPLREQFDLILLDTPPGLGKLSGMAVLAADGLLIPALAADLDVRGAGKLYDLVEGEVPGLRILGVLIAASERRWRVTRDAARADDRGCRCGCCRSTSRGRCGSPRRRATARRPRCSSRTRWSATPTGSSRVTCCGSSGDERAQPMPSARRRPIPGMASEPVAPRAARPVEADQPDGRRRGRDRRPEPDRACRDDAQPDAPTHASTPRPRERAPRSTAGGPSSSGGRRPTTRARGWSTSGSRWTCTTGSAAWSARPRTAIRRLRQPSLTELVIALLEEGPQTADEVAELIRRKRAAEHGAERVK